MDIKKIPIISAWWEQAEPESEDKKNLVRVLNFR